MGLLVKTRKKPVNVYGFSRVILRWHNAIAGPLLALEKNLRVRRKFSKISCAAVRNKTVFGDYCYFGAAKIVRNMNGSRYACATLKK